MIGALKTPVEFTWVGLTYCSIILLIATEFAEHFSRVFRALVVISPYRHVMQIGFLRPRELATKPLGQSKDNRYKEGHMEPWSERGSPSLIWAWMSVPFTLDFGLCGNFNLTERAFLIGVPV